MRIPALSNCQKLRSDPPFCEKCSTIDSDRYSLIFALITENVDGARRCRTRISKGDFGTLKNG